MQHQSIAEAMNTDEMVSSLESSCSGDEGKMGWRECLLTLLQVVSAVGFCGIINLVAM